MKRWFAKYAKKAFLRSMEGLTGGFLELACPDAMYTFGEPSAELRAMAVIHDERFFVRAVTGADVGIGESYMDGDWTSPDLVALVRLVTRNLRRIDSDHSISSAFRSAALRLRHLMRNNSISGSRRNIAAHYDLGNEFYRLFLDSEMLYSSGYFESPTNSLEDAQREKMDRICEKLGLTPGDRVLEIGCGWGGFAIHAARNYGAQVTGVTISKAQFDFANARLAETDTEPGRVKFLLEDYRRLEGRFDKIVSIEMFEAVGLPHYDEFFGTCDRLLAPDGSMLLQTIVLPEQQLKAYRRRVDWIQTYIFPGSELAFLGEIQKSLARVTQLGMNHLESFGLHYAKTLELWRERFFQKLSGVQQMGFPETFVRMWDFYMAWCEGAFRERYIDVVHLVLLKSEAQRAPVLPSRFPEEQFLHG